MLLSFLSYFTIFTLFTIAFGVNAFVIWKDQKIPEDVSPETRTHLLQQMRNRGVSRLVDPGPTATFTPQPVGPAQLIAFTPRPIGPAQLTTTANPRLTQLTAFTPQLVEPAGEESTDITPATIPAPEQELLTNSSVDEPNPTATSPDQSTFLLEKKQKYLEIKQFLTDLVKESISFFSFFSEPLIYPSMQTVATIINYRYLVEENVIKRSNLRKNNNVINDVWIRHHLAMSVYSSMSVEQLGDDVINAYEFPPEFSNDHVAPFVNQIFVKQVFAKLNNEPIGNEIELMKIFNSMQMKLESVASKFGMAGQVLRGFIMNAIISLGYSNKIFLQSKMVNILNNEYYFVDYLDYLIEKGEIKGDNPTDAAFNFMFEVVTSKNTELYEGDDKQKMQSVLPEQLKSSTASVIKHERQENLRRVGRNWIYGITTSAAVTAIAAMGVYNLAQ